MKRLLSLVLLVCMLAALAACATKAKVAEAPILTEPETTEPETDAPAQPPTDPPAPPETGEDDDPALTHGTVVDDVYTNETLNLRVALADGFIFFDDAQIAQMCGMSEAMFRGTEMAKEVARVGQMIDMVMASPNGSNLSLTIHPAQKFLENATDEDIFNVSRSTAYMQAEASGMTVKTYETVKMQLFGEEKLALHIVLSMMGIDVEEYQVWILEKGEPYFAVATVVLNGDVDPQSILDCISRLHEPEAD